MSKSAFSLLVFVFTFSILVDGFSQSTKQPQGSLEPPQPQVVQEEKKAENLNLIKGTVKEVAKDKTYIVVDDTKILTTKEFLDESYLEVGDKVEITVEKTNDGLKAVSYNYVFEEEPASESLGIQVEEDISKEEEGSPKQ